MRIKLAQNHMATTFEFFVSCDATRSRHAESVLLSAHRLVQELELELSEYLPQSPVHRLNHGKPGVPIKFSDHGNRLLTRAQQLNQLTHGAFDCTAKSRMELSPSAEKPAVRIENQNVIRTAGTHLGFGAIGKGYALDQVRTLLEQHGYSDFLLNAGGSSLIFSGHAERNEPWQWAWSWSKDQDGNYLGIEFSHFTGRPIALGISGTLEQGAHLIDPRNLRVTSQVRSALVACSSAADADALSTALFVAGWEEGYPRISSQLITPAAAVIDGQGVPSWNGLFQSFWGAPARAVSTVFLACLASSFLTTFLGTSVALADGPSADEVVDLGSMGGNAFNPYLYERNPAWILLPVFVLSMVLLHLKKVKAGDQSKLKGRKT
ncbi:MAG: FAD:protein FMN transferase [Methylotenera sp.]|nr:FAD:protein FMN transferase [Oligoflexia bacterium]